MKITSIIQALVLLHAAVAMARDESTDKYNPHEKLLIDESNGIEDQWIVVLNDRDAEDISETVNMLVEKYGVSKTNYVYTKALQGFSAEMSTKAAEAMSRDRNVAFIEQNKLAELLSDVASWGLDRIDDKDLPLDDSFAPAYVNGGKNVTAYILDTGIRPTHVDFGGRASAIDCVGSDDIGQDGIDRHWHGTSVAGVVGSSKHGVAKQVTLVSLRVCPCLSGKHCGCLTSATIAGIDYATKQTGPRVINISIAISISLGWASALDNAIAGAVHNGVVVVVGAATEDVDACTLSPASSHEAITVGGTTNNDFRMTLDQSKAGFCMDSGSAFGPCVDIFAPGCDVSSTGFQSDTGVARTCSGTSFAAAHVTGAAALILGDHPHASPAMVRAKIMNDAVLDTISDAKTNPNRMLYVGPVPCEGLGSPCNHLKKCCGILNYCAGRTCRRKFLPVYWPERWRWPIFWFSSLGLFTVSLVLKGWLGMMTASETQKDSKTKGD